MLEVYVDPPKLAVTNMDDRYDVEILDYDFGKFGSICEVRKILMLPLVSSYA